MCKSFINICQLLVFSSQVWLRSVTFPKSSLGQFLEAICFHCFFESPLKAVNFTEHFHAHREEDCCLLLGKCLFRTPSLFRRQPFVTVIRAKLILNAFRKNLKLAIAGELCNEHEPIQMHESLWQPTIPASKHDDEDETKPKPTDSHEEQAATNR